MRHPRRGPAALAVTSTALIASSWLWAGSAGAQTATQSAVAPASASIIYNAAGVPNYDRNPGFSGDGGKAGTARLNTPTGVATDLLGNMYFADTANNRIRKVASATTGTITTVAGNGTFGFSGDGAAATSAKLGAPIGVAVDSAGDIFIADTLNERIREVTPDGKIKTVAGNGSCPDQNHGAGDGGPATSARLCIPTGVAVDGSSVFIADTLNSEVRKFSVGGTISKLAGFGQVSFPEGVAADPVSHSVYVGDTFDNQIKKITQPGGVISTFGGSGSQGFADGSAGAAKFNLPSGVAVSQGDVYVSDTGNDRIRKISGGNVSTFGGTGAIGYSGDGGPALQAKLHLPENLCQDQDYQNSMGGNCQIYLPTGVAGSTQPGEVFLADTNNNHIRAITPGAPPVIPETNYSLLLPLSAMFLAAGGYVIIRRRRSPTARVTA